MGRRFPSEANPHLAVSFFFVVAACMAITMSIITAICGSRSKKQTRENSSPPSSPLSGQDPQVIQIAKPIMPDSNSTHHVPEEQDLPLPPRLKDTSTDVFSHDHTRVNNSSVHWRKLKSSLSMKLPPVISKTKKDEKEKCLWKKTIILGERCRIPGLNEDAILYDDNGKRISAFSPRKPRSLPVSRSSSFIDPNSVPD